MKTLFNFLESVRRKITIWRYLIFTVVCFVGFFAFGILGSIFENQDVHVVFYIIAVAFLIGFGVLNWFGLVYMCLYYIPFKSGIPSFRTVPVFFVGLLFLLLPIGLIYVVSCTGDNYRNYCYILEPFVFPYRIFAAISK